MERRPNDSREVLRDKGKFSVHFQSVKKQSLIN